MAKRSKKGSITNASFKKPNSTNGVSKTKNDQAPVQKLKKKLKAKSKQSNQPKDEEVLLQDILDLGGKASDLKLIKSGSITKKKNKKKDEDENDLDKEIAKMREELKFDEMKQEEKEYEWPGSAPVQESTKPVEETKPDIQTESVQTQILEISRNVKIQNMPKHSLIDDVCSWHEMFPDDPKNEGIDAKSREAMWLHELATKYLQNEVAIFSASKNKKNAEWMKTMISSGTLPDKVTALSLQLKESPVQNLTSLESLLTISKKNEKRVSFLGLEAIKELLLNDLIPDSRRLRQFHAQPIKSLARALVGKDTEGEWSHKKCKSRLILWAFEDELKKLISSFVDRIRELSYDCLEVSKLKAMRYALDLLKKKPEQEKAFLSMLVDKLGDPKKKIAAKALHMLGRLITQHSAMQGIVMHEVRDLLFRPNLAARSQYYCICFLNSLVLSDENKEVVQKLVKIYMSFFKACTKAKIKYDDKMLSALLTGVSRAFPFADMAEKEVAEEMDILFKTVHVTNLNTTTRALVLLYQVFKAREEVSDRFYNALYSSLLHTELPKCTSRHPMYLNLLYRAMKSDPCEPRVQAFVKRLLQICTLQQAPFVAASLVLVHQLTKARPSLAFGLFSTGSTTSTSGDTSGKATSAPDIGAIMSKLGSDDEDEHFVDIRGDSDVEDGDAEEREKEKKKLVANSWVHQHSASMRNNRKGKMADGGSTAYDPLHRNPQFASAECTSLWELHALKNHYHPTVQKYAQCLMDRHNGSVDNDVSALDHLTGDPLEDHTLLKFLDRFVYRNAKTSQKKLQAKATRTSVHQRTTNANFSQSILPVNSAEFLQKKDIKPEEVFFHKYFTSLASLNSAKKPKLSKEIESVTDEEFDKFIASDAGQKEIDTLLNYSDHVYKNKNKDDDLDDVDFGEDSDDDDAAIQDEGGDIDDELNDDELADMFDEDGELKELEMLDEDDFGDDEDILMSSAGHFQEINDDEPKAKKSKKQTTNKKSTLNKSKKNKSSSKTNDDDDIIHEFDEMIASNTNDNFDTIGSSAVVNMKSRTSNKQMKWEKKMEERDIVAEKRKRKRTKQKGKKFGGNRK